MNTKHLDHLRRMSLLAVCITTWCLSSLAFGAVTDISAQEAQTLIAQNSGNTEFTILDIRTPPEFAQGHITGAVLIDYTTPQFKSQLDQLDKTKTYLVYCRSGNRSGRALEIFRQLGFNDIYHLKRGINEWQAKGFQLVRPQ